MKFVIYYFYIIIFFLKSYLFAENKHPIILIHGFLGWGREEMGNYFYWGGSQDFQQNLFLSVKSQVGILPLESTQNRIFRSARAQNLFFWSTRF